MRYERCHSSPDFYKVKGVIKPILSYIKFTIDMKYRYFKDLSWHVHRSFIVALTQLGYSHLGHVDYSHLDDDLKSEIEMEKNHWYKGKPKEGSLVSSAAQARLTSAYATLYLTPDAPEYVVKAVWKALAKETHPDVGGRPEEFKKYQKAYNIIKG